MKLNRFFVLPLLASTIIFASAKWHTLGGDPVEKGKILMRVLTDGLNQMHLNPNAIDDAFSEKLYNLYLKRMDNNKRFFTQQDIDVFVQYKTRLDDQIKGGSFAFYDAVNTAFDRHLKQIQTWYPEILAQPFTFDGNEKIETDGLKIQYAADDAALRQRWVEFLKYQVLDELVSRQRKQEKEIKEKPETVAKTIAELEVEARKKVLDNYDKWSKRVDKLNADDDIEVFLNAITSTYDPHTNYFAPAAKENFDIGMSGKLEGIGAQLREDEGYVKVTNIVPGSPSWRQGELKENDIILKVAQGKTGEFVDCYDMRLDDVVKMIRGAKGTEVRLLAKKANGVEKEITIIRDVVVMDEGFAKSTILKDKKTGLRVGFIDLPKFYADFDDPRGRRCSTDVREELRKLRAEKVDGIVLDLRDNGGGSLSDVVDMGGYFIKDGPIVQVKGREPKPYVMSDRNGSIEWDGPLVIMINCFSASASEILAAAMQDYGRAIIVGDPFSFGKGTVQRFTDLDQAVNGLDEIKPLGSLKVTMQKFYRINGGSTQLRGVASDIILPNVYNYINIGERDEDYPMSWDEISAANYKSLKMIPHLKDIKKKSLKRVNKSEIFQLIDEQAKWSQKQRENTAYPLDLKGYRAYEDEVEAVSKKYESLRKENTDLEISTLQEDLATINADSSHIARNNAWHKTLAKDPYVSEVMNVMFDWIGKKGIGTDNRPKVVANKD